MAYGTWTACNVQNLRSGVMHFGGSLAEMPPRAVVGTASLRRQALVRRLRPDLDVVTYRGNVQSRLAKLADGVVDATLLASAGLNRLGLGEHITSLIETEDFLPAVGQGPLLAAASPACTAASMRCRASR